MRRAEFLEESCDWDWSDAMSFCWNNGYDSMVEDFYTPDSRDEYINNDLSDMIRDRSWNEVRDTLNEYLDSDNYDCWKLDYYYGEWEGLNDTDDLRNFIEELLETLDDDNFFDEDDEEEEDDGNPPFYAEEPGEFEDPEAPLFCADGDLNTYFADVDLPAIPRHLSEVIAEVVRETVTTEEATEEVAFKTMEPEYKAQMDLGGLWK